VPGVELDDRAPFAAGPGPRPLRVAVFAAQTARITNGVGTYAAALASALATAGHGVTLVTPEADPQRAPGVAHRRVRVSPIDPSPGRWWSLAYAFAREAAALDRTLAPDVLHFADAREALGVRRLRTETAIVGTVHDDYAASAPRSPRALRAVHPDPWKRAAWYAVQRALERRAYRRLDRVIANSDAVARAVSSAYGIPLGAMAVVHPAVPDDGPLAHGERYPGDPAILFVGTNFFRKGLATLIEAAARLRDALRALTIFVIGEDPRQAAAEALVETSGLAGRVRFLGHCERSEVLEAYGRAGLVAVPSHTEGFGLVLLEAMRAGVPVIGGDVSGTRELIRHGVDGLLVRPGDVGALAGAIRALRDDATLRAALVESGRRRAAGFSVAHCLDRTLAVYRNVLDGNRRV
jgi:glycosyltransferase involved in cell wall biosynthesis